ncbi:hypothetical protein CASFOL_007096 [Castilleja foliolosa]|uniref:PX domain-containing protein n=1 Tax=Castilleja foliolosa TaxID=1961234 RepID=A0ABD3E8B2_9LAMI
MRRLSPPKHRHDGTSPLPLGMDWSPPPRNWAGRETIWPHDPRTGWSYCITVPSWIVLAKSRDSDPIVFYRVQVGLQSPEGITTTRTVLRRFNDFLKLHAALKRTFPGKYVPPTPPKGLMQMKTRGMLETRRSSLEEWMIKLLSDIDVSRSIVVASFLELEAAARSSFQEDGQSDSHISQSAAHSTLRVPDASSLSAVAGSSSLASDYGSDTAYEASEIGSPCPGRDNNSELSMEDLSYYDSITSPVDKFLKYGMSNIDEGLSMGQSIIEKLEGFPRHKLRATELHFNLEHDTSNGSSSKASRSEPDHSTVVRHVRKLSNESIGSDRSSDRGSELSNIAFPKSNGLGFGLLDFRSGAEDLRKSGTVDVSDDVHLLVPIDQSQTMNRLLTTLQRKLITAKTDMEDLISRLNQEIAVKDYLSTKVKDLEVELETTKQKGKENLEQAMLIERERVTQMQWDMEELRQTAMGLELKLKFEQAQSMDTQSTISSTISQPHKDVLHQELDSAKQKFEDLLKRHQELVVRSKADIKILVKEVKSLRSSHAELTKQLDQSLKEKSQATELLQEEKERNEQTRTSWGKFLHKYKILHDQLQEFHINNLKHTEEDDVIGTSDSQISLLLSEVQRLGQDTLTNDRVAELDDDSSLRQMLTSILVDNGVLRKQVNSLIK